MKKTFFRSFLGLLPTLLKYAFSLALTLWAYTRMGSERFLLAGALDVGIIAVFSNLVLCKSRLGRIINSLLLFLYNLQVAVLGFGSSYITMVMVTNLASLEALAGNAVLYISAAVLILLFSLLPVRRIPLPRWLNVAALAAGIAAAVVFGTLYYPTDFPLYNYADLGMQHHKAVQLERKIAAAAQGASLESLTDINFYREGVADHVSKPADLPEKPNILLIFTEGLSQNVVDDSREITPHISALQKQSLNFTRYYNHTFATYRGIIGQLYSGYQLNNLDSNALVSLQGILSREGYRTTFLNTEPRNADFTNYLNAMDFDQVITGDKERFEGPSNSLSDKEAYELFLATAEQQAQEDAPFFLAMYTFGTHASFNSPHAVFGDGTDAELNKFFNMDEQFGRFMEQYLASDWAKDTLLVFTADHATYQDDAFNQAFPQHPRSVTSLDAMPLFFYYPGITPQQVDVQGRNTLCMAPTLLDYLDISAPNYFLGTSLFASQAGGLCETTFNDTYVTCTSAGGSLASLAGERSAFETLLENYYITKEIAAAQATTAP